jgi:hypothetical protein
MKKMEMKGALTLPHNHLLEKRMNMLRITHESVMNWGRKVIAYNGDINKIFCTKAEIDDAQVASWSLISLAEVRMKLKN